MEKRRDKKVHKSTDEVIEEFIPTLTEFHGLISSFAIKNSDADIELAINRISNALTCLNKRNRARQLEGNFGKEQ